MIKEITWRDILPIWSKYLWPARKSPIEPNSAMVYLDGHDPYNMTTTPSFFGYLNEGVIVGVNSGHMCSGGQYRSRGLWVDPAYRGNGIGQQLLLKTLNCAVEQGAGLVWSLPRWSSWSTYKAVGFRLASEWHPTETSEKNAYCVKVLK